MTDDNSKETSSTETHAVEYTGSAALFRHTMTGLVASPGAPYVTGLSPDEADDLLRTGAFERADSGDVPDEPDEPVTTAAEPAPEPEAEAEPEPEPPEPLGGTVAELEDALATGDWDGELVDLYNLEKEHKNRSTAIEVIQDRRDELREQATDDTAE